MRTVVFDLDGTLADTSGDLIAAANACFRARGLPDQLDPVADALVSFQGGRAMLRLGYQRADYLQGNEWADDDYARLLQFYAQDLATHTRLYPGAVDAVRELRGRGFLTAVCTNKPEGLAHQVIANFEMTDLFDALVGADTLPVRKPNPAPYHLAVERAGGTVRRSILIGDTQTDRETARNAGVSSVLVTFGPAGQGIARLEPDALLDYYTDLPELAERLLPI